MNEPEIIDKMLHSTKTIAVVGLSDKPSRASHGVSAYMQRQGYRIVPVNPALKQVLGEICYSSLQDVPFSVDMVNVFRAPEHVPQIVYDAIAIRAKYLWLQEGVVHPEAIRHAEQSGIPVVANRCLFKEYLRWRADGARH